MKVNPHRSSLGMDANIAALLCYLAAFVLSWIPVIKYIAPAAPLVIYFLEKESPFVKFHAMQAFLLELVNWVLVIVLEIIAAIITAAYVPTVDSLATAEMALGGAVAAASGALAVSGIMVVLSVILFIFAIIAIVKAVGYFEFKLPIIGNLAMSLSAKFSQK